ncbi:MAG: hypothetical protein MPJ78_19150 [Hyphomicrobiaceae bacterium]|nr:hypothetical protein [Hyphomicrobiaceae bacterium]
MRRQSAWFFTFGLLCALGAGATHAESHNLEGAALEKAVAGKIVYMSDSAGTVPIHYKADKTMSGKLQMVTAVLAVTAPKRDQGKWWVQGDRLCQRWNRWLDAKTHCYKLKRDGNNVLWERNDGRKGKARVGK